MAVNFPSAEWTVEFQKALNNNPVYAEAARNWEGDFYFIVDPGGTLTEKAVLYMDLWHGKCRDACLVADPAEKTPAFRLSGPAATWKRVMTKQLDPMQAMMTGQLKLQGNMAIVMRNVRAAKELVESSTRVPTDFPI